MTHTLTSLLGMALPVLQAPMAGVQDHRLAVAVARAGGLGAIPAAMLGPDALRTELAAFRQACPQAPLNVNFFCHTPPQPDPAAQARWLAALRPYHEAWGIDPATLSLGPGRTPFNAATADVLAEFRPDVLSFHFGLPAPDLLARVRGMGARVLCSATTVAEGLWLQDQGVDAVIAQGLEAGGHRGHFLSNDLSLQLGTMALVPQLAQALRVPVIAAGGVSTPQAVAAAQALGAAGVQAGTAYLLCPEATTSAVHRAALQSPAVHHTALTRLFSGGPARGMPNRLMRELGAMNEAAPAFPLATAALAPLRAAAEAQGLPDFSPLWAGQAASACRTDGAAAITQWLATGWQGL
ncbi:MAG: 2-nitropropane dioxygenase [Polaromonas sp.]|nr:2-nitropropane dioxygenase [Polaromonas sp.]